MMLGFDIQVEDRDGRALVGSQQVMDDLPPSMKRRMQAILHMHAADVEYERYPLYVEGKELGTLLVRPLHRAGPVQVKEDIFKKRGTNFLVISFIIAGAGALGMSVFLSLYLSRPLKILKSAAERVAGGDFSVRVGPPLLRGSQRPRILNDEILRLAESFNYMAEALEKEEALRKRLTSNVAHELRTPLAVMKAHVEAMIDGVIEVREESLENIRAEIEKLTHLVEGIEDLTKAEASFFAGGEYKRINLRDFLASLQGSMRPVFQEKGLQLSLTDGEDLFVVTDVEKLEKILGNIIANALKYTEKGGVRVDYRSDGGEFTIEVKDSGIGIPEEEVPKVFTRFYRGKESPGTGVGIGLAIVKELVAIMGGQISLKSTMGEGSTFTVRLPVKETGRGEGIGEA